MRALALVLTALLLLSCATGRSVEREYKGELVVQVNDFDAKTVRLYCGSVLQVVVRNLAIGQEITRKLRGTCHQDAYLLVEYLGSRVWLSPPFEWNEGQTIRLDIGVRPSFNFVIA